MGEREAHNDDVSLSKHFSWEATAAAAVLLVNDPQRELQSFQSTAAASVAPEVEVEVGVATALTSGREVHSRGRLEVMMRL